MGATEILERIRADGAARVAAVAQERDRLTSVVEERAKAEAGNVLGEWQARAAREAAAIVERARGSARLQLRNSALAARWSALDRVAESARGKVLAGKDYPDLLAGIVKRIARPDSEVLLSDADIKAYGVRLGANNIKPAPIAGGVIVRTGREEENYSLDETLAVCREESAAELSRILFGN